MLPPVKQTLLGAGAASAAVAMLIFGLIAWPEPLFAFSIGTGKIVVASDRPIPAAGGDRLLGDCERLLDLSPLKAESRQYRLYVANEDWRHRLYFLPVPNAGGLSYYYGFGGHAFLSGADFATGRLVKWGYVTTPPRTLAYFCAHELTHIIVGEHIGLAALLLRLPQWVHEGFADYVAIEQRQSFEQLRDALGERPVDVAMMQKYGAYPRYRLLVTYFIEKQGWTIEDLLRTRLTFAQAMGIMRAGVKG
jgi:hypothetical protein